LKRDVPIEVDPADATLGGWDIEELRRLFDFLEFRTLWDRFIEATGNGEKGGAAEAPAGSALDIVVEELPHAVAAVERCTRWQASAAPLALAGAWEGREGRSPLQGLAFAPLPPGDGPVGVVWFGGDLLGDPGVRAALGNLLGDDGVDVS